MLLVNHPESADASAKCDLLMCVLRWVLWANDLVQTVQENGFSPVWVLLCITKCAGFLNALSHFWHLYCLWLLWMDWWLKRWLDLLKLFSQTLQEYGLAPEWITLWQIRSLLSRNVFWQISQRCKRSLVCNLWWFFKWDDWVKDFSQCLHLNGFSPVWLLSCTLTLLSSEKVIGQMLQ